MRGRKAKDEKYYGEINELLFLQGKSIMETAEYLRLNVWQIQMAHDNIKRKKRNLSKFASGAKNVKNYYRNKLKSSRKIEILKNMLDDGEFDTVLTGNIVMLYEDFFCIQYDENGRFECFLYSDLFTEEILIRLLEGGTIVE